MDGIADGSKAEHGQEAFRLSPVLAELKEAAETVSVEEAVARG